mgnify:CR=1 FL=1
MRKQFKLIDMIEGKVLGEGTLKELSTNFDIHDSYIKWSYYQKEIVKKRYLVIDKEKGGI